MVQRKQTIYLSLTFLVLCSLFFIPLAQFENHALMLWFRASGIMVAQTEKLVVSTLPYFILLIICALLPLAIVFFYKKRGVQMLLCLVEIILLFGMLLFQGYYLTNLKEIAETLGASVHYSAINVVPAMGILLMILAYLGIRKDEALVKSLDRIR